MHLVWECKHFEHHRKEALSLNLCSLDYIKETTDQLHGKLGCNLSYLYLFKHIAETSADADWHLIIEDDVRLDPSFPDFLEKVKEDLQQGDSDYVLLYPDPRLRDAQFSSHKHLHGNLYQMVPQYGTVAQLIKTAGVKKILSHLPLNDNIDFWRNNNIPLLSATVAKNNLTSNLGSSSR